MANLSWQRPGSEEEHDKRDEPMGAGEAADADDIRVAGSPSDETRDDDLHTRDPHAGEPNADERFGETERADETPFSEAPADETPIEETPIEETPAEETHVAETPVDETPADEPQVDEAPAQAPPTEEAAVEERLEQFMDPGAAASLRERWRDVQSGFVDDPRQAVEQADNLASEVLHALSETLTERKRTLDGEWRGSSDESSDTEKLRLALRGYRDFFDRMLSI